MLKLIKVSAHDCAICASMVEADVRVSEFHEIPMEVVELGDLAATPGAMHDYVVGYHLQGDGSVTVPIYMVADGDNIQASGEVKTEEELVNLVYSWEVWKNAHQS